MVPVHVPIWPNLHCSAPHSTSVAVLWHLVRHLDLADGNLRNIPTGPFDGDEATCTALLLLATSTTDQPLPTAASTALATPSYMYRLVYNMAQASLAYSRQVHPALPD